MDTKKINEKVKCIIFCLLLCSNAIAAEQKDAKLSTLQNAVLTMKITLQNKMAINFRRWKKHNNPDDTPLALYPVMEEYYQSRYGYNSNKKGFNENDFYDGTIIPLMNGNVHQPFFGKTYCKLKLSTPQVEFYTDQTRISEGTHLKLVLNTATDQKVSWTVSDLGFKKTYVGSILARVKDPDFGWDDEPKDLYTPETQPIHGELTCYAGLRTNVLRMNNFSYNVGNGIFELSYQNRLNDFLREEWDRIKKPTLESYESAVKRDRGLPTKTELIGRNPK